MSTKKRQHVTLDNKTYDHIMNLSAFYDVSVSQMIRSTILEFYRNEIINNKTFSEFVKETKDTITYD